MQPLFEHLERCWESK